MTTRYTLIFILIAFFGTSTQAQTCAIDPLFANVNGISPDSATNFASGTVGVPYNQNITVHVPADTTPAFPPIPIPFDSVTMASMTGLPPGLVKMCSPSGCSWLGNSSGCAAIYGTPTTAGIYPLTILVKVYLGGSTTPITQTLTYYKIVIAPATGIGANTSLSFEVKQNNPNQFSGKTTIHFTAPSNDEKVKFCVFNTLGKVIIEKTVDSVKGDNEIDVDARNLASGFYFYTVEYKGKTFTKRMMVSNY